MIATIDIGGTNIRMAYWKKGEIVGHSKVKTDPESWQDNIKDIVSFINNAPETIEAVGVGIPGPADYQQGVFFNPPNLKGWWNFDLKSELIKRTGISKIYFENDANLMALANHKQFGYTDKDITQFFTISTGLGAGLIINDEVYRGAYGQAQEIAMMPVNTYAEKNEYSKGSLEYYASGGGIQKRAKRHIGNISTKEVFQLYSQGDTAAVEIVNQGIESLANLIAIVGGLINPTSIIFDGSVARNEKWYVNEAVKIAKERMYSLQSKTLKYHISNLGDDSTLMGAYYMAKKMIGE